MMEEAIRYPGVGVTGSCELPARGAGNSTVVLWNNRRHTLLLSHLPSPGYTFLVLVATNNFYNLKS